MEDFTSDNDPTIVFDEHISLSNAEAALLSQRSSAKNFKQSKNLNRSVEKLKDLNKENIDPVENEPIHQLH